jgi:amidohydrolase
MNFEQEVVEIRRHIHQNPELSNCEFNTANFIENKLRALKLKVKRVGKTAVMADLITAKNRQMIALRADIDALPILEQNSAVYKSKISGIMHACGHDAHTAIILGAAKLLAKSRNSLNGNVRFLFQPAEETSNGAENFIKSGALKNPKPEFILGVHVNPWIKSGFIGIKYGEMMAAVDKLNITISGKIAHGAYPDLGKDAIAAASIFINSVQPIISREIAPADSAVITFGKICGGQSYNILCDEVNIEGTVRTLNEKTRKFIKQSILDKLKSIEIAYGVKCKIDYQHIGSPLINDKKITKFCHSAANEFYGEQKVLLLDKPSMGGEDFSDYLKEILGNFIYIGSSKNEKTSYTWHHTNFDIDETVLPKASKFLAFAVEKYFNGRSDK